VGRSLRRYTLELNAQRKGLGRTGGGGAEEGGKWGKYSSKKSRSLSVSLYGGIKIAGDNVEGDGSCFPSQLLQVTRNRIRELRTDSLKRYVYLKYLYLDDNLILDIESGTFAPLLDLEVIRLSRNAIDSVPHDLLRLPKIRKIFLDNNPLIPGGGFVGAPASETLESLNLAQCRLQELPPLEVFSSLLELNVSGNNLKTISPQQLAPMCQLHWLDLKGNPKLSDGNSGDGCNCHLLASWIADRNIVLQSGYELKCASNRQSKSLFIEFCV
jgi:Leucine-rich repeat (LRR) protein